MRKAVWLFCIVASIMVLVPVAAAAETVGSIQVKLETGELPVINGTITLYQVGVKIEDGYRITEGFGGGIVHQDEADSQNLAQWLAESAGENGTTHLFDADGRAFFPELEEGLYMIVQTERVDGFYPIQPVLLTIPDGTRWDVSVNREPVPVVTELPQTGQSPIPFLGLLGMLLSSSGLLLCVRKNRKHE